jgi:hypothetical protein
MNTADDIIDALVAGEITAAKAVSMLMALGMSKEDAEYQVNSTATVDVVLR